MIRMRPSLWLHSVPSQGLLLLFYINIETLPTFFIKNRLMIIKMKLLGMDKELDTELFPST